MSCADNGNCPAFPVPGSNRAGQEGMTLRDWFAGKELQKTKGAAVCDHPDVYKRLADHCYRMADAMIAERNRAP